jgi:hypothetical protein
VFHPEGKQFAFMDGDDRFVQDLGAAIRALKPQTQIPSSGFGPFELLAEESSVHMPALLVLTNNIAILVPDSAHHLAEMEFVYRSSDSPSSVHAAYMRISLGRHSFNPRIINKLLDREYVENPQS